MSRAATVSNNSTFTLPIEVGPHAPGTTLGLYKGHDAAPVPHAVFPDTAAGLWFAVASFHTLAFVEAGNAGVVPALHSTWGALKARFR